MSNSKSGLFFGLSLLFLVGCGVAAMFLIGNNAMAIYVIIAAVAGGYMALNIGANDVANNVSPAFGSGAITLVGAIILAAIFETAGALIAGGTVVSTISKNIVNASMIPDTLTFIHIMIAALFAAALWLNLATFIGAPVSTTHSIVGAVLGSGIAAVGFNVVHWDVMMKIAASWVISPVLGGFLAAAVLAFIDRAILRKDNVLRASTRWVPVLLAIMAAAFTMYLAMKGLKKIIKIDQPTILAMGAGAFVLTAVITRPLIMRASDRLENHRRGVNKLFTIPLVCSAALLSFAHGANDVANAIGPLSAVVSAVQTAELTDKAIIPLWTMIIGAVGIALGLALYGAKLIKKVGKHLTALNQTRAYCVCLSAAVTVIAATTLGLPVSSTHIAIGAVFGVGLYREYVINRRLRQREPLFVGFESKAYNPRKLVRRSELFTIASAWIITVPSAAIISAVIFYLIRQSI